MKRIPWEEMMKRRAKRTSAFETRQLHREHIKSAVIRYLEDLPIFRKQEIIDVDIPDLTTDLVDVNIYIKEAEPSRGKKL